MRDLVVTPALDIGVALRVTMSLSCPAEEEEICFMLLEISIDYLVIS